MDHQQHMTRRATILAVLLPLSVGLFACADRSEGVRAQRVANEATANAEDDATCRAKGEPGTELYEGCRQALAAARAEKAAIQEQKRRDFDRVLGAGTDGLSDY
jgi:hypothetical protein